MTRHVLVYGASGALGKSIVNHFKNASWTVTGLDFTENNATNYTIQLPKGGIPPKDALLEINHQMADILKKQGGNGKLDAIINVAGGWAGGSIKDDSLFDTLDLMMNQSLSTSLIATKLAAQYLQNNGLLVLTGAAAALGPTPGMIGYGLAKASVHHLIKSCGSDPSASGMAAGVKVVGICPIMLDTPMNRKYMAEGTDTSSWTPLSRISSELLEWAENQSKVKNGGLYKIVTKDNITEFVESD